MKTRAKRIGKAAEAALESGEPIRRADHSGRTDPLEAMRSSACLLTPISWTPEPLQTLAIPASAPATLPDVARVFCDLKKRGFRTFTESAHTVSHETDDHIRKPREDEDVAWLRFQVGAEADLADDGGIRAPLSQRPGPPWVQVRGQGRAGVRSHSDRRLPQTAPKGPREVSFGRVDSDRHGQRPRRRHHRIRCHRSNPGPRPFPPPAHPKGAPLDDDLRRHARGCPEGHRGRRARSWPEESSLRADEAGGRAGAHPLIPRSLDRQRLFE